MISNALSLMIAIPLLGAVISFFAGSKAKFVALLASLAPLYPVPANVYGVRQNLQDNAVRGEL